MPGTNELWTASTDDWRRHDGQQTKGNQFCSGKETQFSASEQWASSNDTVLPEASNLTSHGWNFHGDDCASFPGSISANTTVGRHWATRHRAVLSRTGAKGGGVEVERPWCRYTPVPKLPSQAVVGTPRLDHCPGCRSVTRTIAEGDGVVAERPWCRCTPVPMLPAQAAAGTPRFDHCPGCRCVTRTIAEGDGVVAERPWCSYTHAPKLPARAAVGAPRTDHCPISCRQGWTSGCRSARPHEQGDTYPLMQMYLPGDAALAGGGCWDRNRWVVVVRPATWARAMGLLSELVTGKTWHARREPLCECDLLVTDWSDEPPSERVHPSADAVC